jgi:predicted ATPase/DNA-binding CsgD family transcriptional regulator
VQAEWQQRQVSISPTRRDAVEPMRRGKPPPTNLPVLRERLVGREQDLAVARRILLSDEVGLLTLTGAGGSGKTSLALHLATDVLDAFDDGAFFVSCAPVADPGLVASTVAQTLGLRDLGDRPVLGGLVDYLRPRSLLLILDNFEQLLPAGPLVADLLAASPGLKVLVTSRAALRVRGEHELLVPPLALPDLRLPADRDMLAHNPSVALFVERAQAVRSTFALTDGNAQSVAEIAVRLDGLPLAIELAAARLRLFSPRELLTRLDHRLPLLPHGARDVPARQRTLRDAIAWSYDLLDEVQQRLFRRLAVFVGGCTLDAVEAICVASHDPDVDVLDGVATLVDMNLLRHEDGGDDESRLVMLETIREYGLERLEASGEAADLRQRHAVYYLGLAESAGVRPWGTTARDSLNRLAREHDNVRAALSWSPDGLEAGDLVARLAAAMSYFWYVRGHFAEGRRWIQGVLGTDAAGAGAIRAQLLAGLGLLAHQSGEYRDAKADLHESLALYRRLGDRHGIAWSTALLGNVAYSEGHLEEAGTLFEESLAQARAADESWLIAVGQYRLGHLAAGRGELALAATHLDSAVTALRAMGERTLLGRCLARLGVVADARGEQIRAPGLVEESLAIAREIGDALGVIQALFSLGWVLHGRREDERAADCLRESLELARRTGVRWNAAIAIHALGQVAQASGDLARAARLFGDAEAVHARIDLTLPVGGAAGHQRSLAGLRSSLGDVAVDALLDEGKAMSWETACDHALADLNRAERPAAGPIDRGPSRAPSELTARELEVITLIARGWTNRQIADELAMAERTAETHARNIREKLGLATRAELVAWANRRDVVADTD